MSTTETRGHLICLARGNMHSLELTCPIAMFCVSSWSDVQSRHVNCLLQVFEGKLERTHPI